jgi:glutathione peroxidase
MPSVHDFTARRIDGREESLAVYKGKALLIVNVASKCGFTPQYEGLQKLYEENRGKGFEVLGFPCNQFGAQEPGDEKEIQNFCSVNYGVTFPMFAKVDVNGDGAQKKGIAGSEAVKWNFTKFLVDRDGAVVARFGPQDSPELISRKLDAAL